MDLKRFALTAFFSPAVDRFPTKIKDTEHSSVFTHLYVRSYMITTAYILDWPSLAVMLLVVIANLKLQSKP